MPISPRGWPKRFPLCENISIDYAVLENADNVVGVACDDFGWNDVGSWNAVYELLPRDEERQCLALGDSGHRRERQLCRLREETGGAAGREGSDYCGHARRAAGGASRRAQNVAKVVEMLEAKEREELL